MQSSKSINNDKNTCLGRDGSDDKSGTNMMEMKTSPNLGDTEQSYESDTKDPTPSTSNSIVLVEPTQYDVLCAQDRTCNNHEGNLIHREQILKILDDYPLGTKRNKIDITKSIVQFMQQTYQSRFLLRINTSSSSSVVNADSNFGWTEITNQQARDKTSHAIRYIIKNKHSPAFWSPNSRCSEAKVDEKSALYGTNSSNHSRALIPKSNAALNMHARNDDIKQETDAINATSLSRQASHPHLSAVIQQINQSQAMLQDVASLNDDQSTPLPTWTIHLTSNMNLNQNNALLRQPSAESITTSNVVLSQLLQELNRRASSHQSTVNIAALQNRMIWQQQVPPNMTYRANSTVPLHNFELLNQFRGNWHHPPGSSPSPFHPIQQLVPMLSRHLHRNEITQQSSPGTHQDGMIGNHVGIDRQEDQSAARPDNANSLFRRS